MSLALDMRDCASRTDPPPLKNSDSRIRVRSVSKGLEIPSADKSSPTMTYHGPMGASPPFGVEPITINLDNLNESTAFIQNRRKLCFWCHVHIGFHVHLGPVTLGVTHTFGRFSPQWLASAALSAPYLLLAAVSLHLPTVAN